jgi:hypothetical protein
VFENDLSAGFELAITAGYHPLAGKVDRAPRKGVYLKANGAFPLNKLLSWHASIPPLSKARW